jgi:hypothetical protein
MERRIDASEYGESSHVADIGAVASVKQERPRGRAIVAPEDGSTTLRSARTLHTYP